MNIQMILQTVQDLRSQLETWGITPEFLWATGAVSLILLVFSLREILGWYLRVYHLRQEVRDLRNQMATMQKTLEATYGLLNKNGSTPKDSGEPRLVLTEPEPTSSARFRLDH